MCPAQSAPQPIDGGLRSAGPEKLRLGGRGFQKVQHRLKDRVGAVLTLYRPLRPRGREPMTEC